MSHVRGAAPVFITALVLGSSCAEDVDVPHIEIALTHSLELVEVELSGSSEVGSLPATSQALGDSGSSLLFLLPPARMVGEALTIQLAGKKSDGTTGAEWTGELVVGPSTSRLQASLAAVCGDGFLMGEGCDDGNEVRNDGCSGCRVDLAWRCEGAPSRCERIPDIEPPDPRCGDGDLDPGEGCDDGNTLPRDGCNSNCTVEDGFECTGDPTTCVAADGTVFVDLLGPSCPFGLGDGSLADPYCAISTAILPDGDRFIVIAPGRYEEKVEVRSSGTKILSGMGLVTIAHDRNHALKIKDGASVEVRDLKVTGSGGTGGGVRVEGTSTIVRLLRLEIGPSLTVGVSVKEGHIELDRCQIVGNAGGGVHLEPAAGNVDVTSTVIAQNGSVMGELGGVWFANTSTSVVFANNTVTENTSKSDQPAGVRCDSELALWNSIIWNNHGESGPGVSEDCVPNYSDLDDDHDEGTGNFSADPEFIDGLYHIQTDANSPCMDRGFAFERAPAFDFDGDPRPQGAGYDVGADEVPE